MPFERPEQPNQVENEILINRMSLDQLAHLRATKPDYVLTGDFASQLSWKQLDELETDTRWTPEEKDQLKMLKGVRRRKHLSEIAPEVYSRLERMDIDKLVVLKLGHPEWFSNPTFVSALKWWQVDAIIKDSRWTSDEKQEIRRLKDITFDDATLCYIGVGYGQEDSETDPEKKKEVRKKMDKLKDRLIWKDKSQRIPRSWKEIQAEYTKYLREEGKNEVEINRELTKAEYLHKQGEKMMWEAAAGRSNQELAKSRGMYWRNPWVFRHFNRSTIQQLREKDRGELTPLIRTLLDWYYTCPNSELYNDTYLTDANVDAILYLVTDRDGKRIYSPEPGDWPLPDEEKIKNLHKIRGERARSEAKNKNREILESLGIDPDSR